MSAPQISAAAQVAEDGPQALQARMDALRSRGAARFDPARFHFLEALSSRLPGQPEPVRRLLQARLQATLADFAEHFEAAQQPAADGRAVRPAARARTGRTDAPLAQLNEYIRNAAAARTAAARPGETAQDNELLSARRFRQAWERGRMVDRMAQAASRKPAKAGPLNSHALVLDSLALMQALSPDYLRRFLAQVESLQWLEQAAGEKNPREPVKKSKPATPRGAARRPRDQS
jgi:hypothetical protein